MLATQVRAVRRSGLVVVSAVGENSAAALQTVFAAKGAEQASSRAPCYNMQLGKGSYALETHPSVGALTDHEFSSSEHEVYLRTLHTKDVTKLRTTLPHKALHTLTFKRAKSLL